MKQRKGSHTYRNRILLAALIAALIYGMAVPAFAGSNGVLERLAINAPSSHEREKAERMLAVENARIAFEGAKATSGEKAAPYEYYLAEGYLKLAIEELGSGDKNGVVQFAAESEKYSRVAGEKAKGYLKLATEEPGTGDKNGVVPFTVVSEQPSGAAGEKVKEGRK